MKILKHNINIILHSCIPEWTILSTYMYVGDGVGDQTFILIQAMAALIWVYIMQRQNFNLSRQIFLWKGPLYNRYDDKICKYKLSLNPAVSGVTD
jgi:hypothetical protein